MKRRLRTNETEELSVYVRCSHNKVQPKPKTIPQNKNLSSTNWLKRKQKIITPKELKIRSNFFEPLELTNTKPTEKEKQAVGGFPVE